MTYGLPWITSKGTIKRSCSYLHCIFKYLEPFCQSLLVFFFVPVSKQRTINNFCLFHGETHSASALPLLLKWHYCRCPGRSMGTPQRSDLFLKHLLTVSISDNTFYRITSLREPGTHETFLNLVAVWLDIGITAASLINDLALLTFCKSQIL